MSASKATLGVCAGIAALLTLAPIVAAHPAHVVMQDLAQARGFEPPVLTVEEGAPITFENLDTFDDHHPISNDADPAATSGGGDCFDAGVLGQGDSVEVTTECTGVLSYRCDIHPWMRGAIRFT